MATERTFLERLVGDARRFTSEYWLQQPYLRRGALPEAAGELLSLPELVNTLTSAALRPPHLRLIKAGEPVAQRHFTRRIKVATEYISDAADPDRILREFGAGATIVLDGLEDYVLSVRQACDALRHSMGVPVHAHGFVTPPGEIGLRPHHDPVDVFVVQVHGSKNWKVYDRIQGTSGASWLYTDGDLGTPVIETRLQPGDVLYLPKGAPHVAAAPEVMSVHVSLACVSETWADHLRHLVEQALESQEFQETPNLFTLNDSDFAAEIKKVAANLSRRLDEGSGGMRKGRHTSAWGLSSALATMENLARHQGGEVTVYRCQPVELSEQPDGTCVLRIPDAVLRMPAKYQPALAVIAEQDSFPLSQVQALLGDRRTTALIGKLAAYGAVSTSVP
ncbi:cupin domain-containing protein [Streptomyces sp. R11]|uniref:Cupin domain-containing protein n=1 Tax=Streptomyces sp. R11 TaxID=3238625 RepID=A0AB39MTV6_9ACTN